MKIYLLLNSFSHVVWSIEKEPLIKMLEDTPEFFILKEVLSIIVYDKLLEVSAHYPQLTQKVLDVPEDFFQRKRQWWQSDFPYYSALRQRGYGICILFNKNGSAQYSFTQKNLIKLYNSKCKQFRKPVWLELTMDQMLKLYVQEELKIITHTN